MRGRLVALLLGVVLGLGCPDRKEAEVAPEPETGPRVADLTPDQRAEARRTILAWLECEECRDGELDSVVALGPTLAVPTLTRTLLEGPSKARRARMEEDLAARFVSLREYAARNPDTSFGLREEEFVANNLARVTARYQMRSAVALAEFGGPEARQALTQALGESLRPDVQRTVQHNLDRLGTP